MEIQTITTITSLLLFISFFPLFTISFAEDTLNATVVLQDGQTLVSSAEQFVLGFFSPGTSTNRYLGIWYNVSPDTVVWVANRQTPITDHFGALEVTPPGILVLLNSTKDVIWSSNTSRTVQNPVAQILDDGNLVVRAENDTDPDNYLWQSFYFPTDTLLPRMKFGKNLITGLDNYLTSWKSPNDPSVGDYINRLDTSGFPQIFISQGLRPIFRFGPWNGIRFSGMPHLMPNWIYNYSFVMDKDEITYSYELLNNSLLSMTILNEGGELKRYIWADETKIWNIYFSIQMDYCDRYGLCGAYGSCNIYNSPACGCLKGFQPKFPNEWNAADWSNGCVRKTALDCPSDGFQRYSGIKVPDTRNSTYNMNMTLQECRQACLKNCNCTAYASADISNGSGCLLWSGDLIDIRQSRESGQIIYVRMAASDLGGSKKGLIIACMILLAILIMVVMGLMWRCRKRRQPLRRAFVRSMKDGLIIERVETTDKSRRDDLELPLFDFAAMADATNDFSIHNKLSEGGFGPVYMGVLKEGQEIAVKRLSKESKQGLNEFKNELNCIAKLQHRNLVKLLGCCIQGEEKMLVYEYMPNKSLDHFIFDRKQSKTLDWPKRFQIINGIARGLLYLHEDSRLRIIHRDLKASNILLDKDVNPKISDFGLARIFGGNETAANTMRVVGTYGYIAPEYTVDGLFSVKSDVFSFGVLVLEIVSGKRNRGFHHTDHQLNLLGHAWKLYKEDNALELVDESIWASRVPSEVVRSIQIGLLCVQQSPEDRPSMASAVVMLGSNNALPEPKLPGFYIERKIIEEDSSSSKQENSCTNELTFTILEAR